MNKLKKILVLCLSTACICLSTITVFAASISISASTGSVAPNGKFTVTIGGNVTGRINVSVSNGSADKASVWIEDKNNSASVTVTAGESGTVTVVAAPIDGLSDENGDPADTSARSVSVSIVQPEAPKPQEPSVSNPSTQGPSTPAQQETPKEDTRSKDNTLSYLSVEGASLSPEFSSSETSYKVALPAETEKININAKANDNKASVSGTGEKTVKAGENKFSVTVTAENDSEKTYTIVATVDEKPLVYSKYEDKNLGFVRNTEGVTVPKDFKETTVTVDDKEVVAWTNEKLNKTIVYMQDDDNNKQFYLYEDGKITSTFQYRKLLGKEVYLIDIPTDKQSITGMTYGELVIDEVTLMGWKFNDPAFENYQLIYVMDMDGNMQYYQYEVTQKTLQLYSQAAAITQATYEKEHESAQTTKTALIASTAIASIIAVASLGYIGFLFYKKKKTL